MRWRKISLSLFNAKVITKDLFLVVSAGNYITENRQAVREEIRRLVEVAMAYEVTKLTELLMANPQHVELMKQRARAFNAWRINNPQKILVNVSEVWPIGADPKDADLSNADLRDTNLSKAYLCNADLSGADLSGADLSNTNLSNANLIHANLSNANLSNANLSHAYLNGANLGNADLSNAYVINANLSNADLSNSGLYGTNFGNADFSNTQMSLTKLAHLDLRTIKGLDTVRHAGSSFLGIDTIMRSQGQIPEIFLRGCGVPDIFIQYIRSLTNQSIQYYSCFISYSTKDEEFAQRLYNDLQAKNVRCWYAPEDIQGGKKLHEQIDDAIRVHDKLLLILSPNSIASEWVKTEIAKARKRESAQKRKLLFPVRLVDWDTLQEWECFDADVGKDSAREIREYFIPDFSDWKTNHDKYNVELQKLLRDLKTDSQ